MAEKKEKCCTGCKEKKPLDQFYKNKTNEDGKSIYCKDCTKMNAKMYYQKKLLKLASENNGISIKDSVFPSNLISLNQTKLDITLKLALIQRLMLTVNAEIKELVDVISEEKMGV